MEEKVYEVEMVYIQNTSGSDYSVEAMGRRSKNIKLKFSNVEGIEIDSSKPLEIKNSIVQMGDGQSKFWNMRFAYATNISIKFTGKIVIGAIL